MDYYGTQHCTWTNIHLADFNILHTRLYGEGERKPSDNKTKNVEYWHFLNFICLC